MADSDKESGKRSVVSKDQLAVENADDAAWERVPKAFTFTWEGEGRSSSGGILPATMDQKLCALLFWVVLALQVIGSCIIFGSLNFKQITVNEPKPASATDVFTTAHLTKLNDKCKEVCPDGWKNAAAPDGCWNAAAGLLLNTPHTCGDSVSNTCQCYTEDLYADAEKCTRRRTSVVLDKAITTAGVAHGRELTESHLSSALSSLSDGELIDYAEETGTRIEKKRDFASERKQSIRHLAYFFGVISEDDLELQTDAAKDAVLFKQYTYDMEAQRRSLLEDSNAAKLGEDSEEFQNTVRRRLEEKGNKERDAWGLLASHVEVPLVILLCFGIVTVGFMAALGKFARMVIWGGIALMVAVQCVLFIYLEAMELLFVPGLVVLFSFCARKSIDRACKKVTMAIAAIDQQRSIITGTILAVLVYTGYFCFWCAGVVESGNWREVDCAATDGANLKQAGGSRTIRTYLLNPLFYPTMFFMQNAIVICCTAGAGKWYLGKMGTLSSEQNAMGGAGPAHPGIWGFKLAYTGSAGVNMTAAIIASVCHVIRQYAKEWGNALGCGCFVKPWLWLYVMDPVHIACAIIWCIIATVAEAFSKYLLIAHTVKPGAIWTTAKRSLATLRKAGLFAAIVVDGVLTAVFKHYGSVICTVAGLASWLWLDSTASKTEKAVLRDGPSENMTWFIIGLILLYMFSKVPTAAVVLMVFINEGLGDSVGSWGIGGLVAGVFLGGLCGVIWNYVSKMIIATADAMFYFEGVEREAEGGHEQSKA